MGAVISDGYSGSHIMPKQTYSNPLASDLLRAQLFRLLEGDGNNVLGLKAENFRLVPTVTRRGNDRLLQFSGVFVNDRVTVMPFTVSFSDHPKEGSKAILRQFAAGGIGSYKSRVTAFLSVIEYLESVAILSSGSFRMHIQSLTMPQAIKDRVDACEAYPEFRRRACRDLPYDDAVVLLGEAVVA
jgi:hypothetical protein